MPGLGVMLLLLLASVSDAELLAQAEAAFRAGIEHRDDSARARPHLLRAIESLEALQTRGVRNRALSLQLGNARLLADDVPGAILAYHQGLDLAPHDRELLAALEQARGRVAYPANGFARPPSDDLPPWLPRPSPTTLLVLTLLVFTLGCLALTRARMLASRRLLGVGSLAILLALVGVVLIVFTERARGREGPLVVIAAEDVLLRRGDGLAYPPRYLTPLPRGTEARLRHQRGDWLQIELTGGEIGWVPRALTRSE